jgi:hypothetical protein
MLPAAQPVAKVTRRRMRRTSPKKRVTRAVKKPARKAVGGRR